MTAAEDDEGNYDPSCPWCNYICGCGDCGECFGSRLPRCHIHGYQPPPANPAMSLTPASLQKLVDGKKS